MKMLEDSKDPSAVKLGNPKTDDTKLTGPEYELLYKLLCDIRKFKQLNEGTDRPVPAFVYRICDAELERFTDKMRSHMYKFWPAYFETCW